MLGAAASATLAAAADSPNIILFLVDDMGWQDTSLPFDTVPSAYNRIFHTPNMERLASQGMMFTSAYASPISSPSRCSLMTGVNAARHGVTNWTLKRDQEVDGTDSVCATPNWNFNGISRVPGINNTYVKHDCFVDRLRESGYHTIHCGKAHFGATDTPGENPIHWGFETNIAGHAAGGLATYLSERNYGHDAEGNPTSPFAVPGLEKYWGTGTFATEALTQEAIKALDKAKLYNQPFFLYMAHYAVHVPIDRDERFFDKYIAEGLDEKEAAYASLVEGMDKSLGDLLDWLDTNDMADSTIVIFMSDNGGLGAHGGWRTGPQHVQNAPLRSGKGSMYEGGMRVPMIVKWPGVTAADTRTDERVIIEDFYPTILDMASVDCDAEIDGVSFTDVLKGNPTVDRDARPLVWNYPNVWGAVGPGIDLNCALRLGDWKLIYDDRDGSKELYNIASDLSETTDLAGEYPQLTDSLSHTLGTLLRSRGAFRPTFKATGLPCPWPDE